MGIKLQYKISLLLNTVLSTLFLALGVFALVKEKIFDNTSVLIIALIFLFTFTFLLFNYLCFEIHKANRNNQPAGASLLVLSKLLFAVCCLMVGFIFFIVITTLITDYEILFSSKRSDAVFFFIFFVLLSLTGISMIMNCIAFFKALKQNKLIVNSVINTIGENTAP